MIKSLGGRLTALNVAVLSICLLALFFVASHEISSRKTSNFVASNEIVTELAASQINTGTRLKRAAMITPQIDALFATEALNVAGVRVVHAEGVEVLTKLNAAAESARGSLFAAPDFEAEVSTRIVGDYAVARTPILLGAGDEQITVGELTIAWDMRQTYAQSADVTWTLAALFVVTTLVLGVTMIVSTGRLASRPIAEAVASMQRLASGDETAKGPQSKLSEIAMISDALDVFRASMRDARVAEENERAAQQLEKEKFAETQRFQEALDGVIRCAERGDFSARLQVEDASAQHDMAVAVNGMLERIETSLAETIRVLGQVAEGDLENRVVGSFDGVFADLQRDVNAITERLSEVLAGVASTAGSVRRGAEVIQSASADLSGRAEQQASSLEETAATMEEMSASIRSNADHSTNAQSLASAASDRAKGGGEIVSEAVGAMSQIEESASKISDIITVIDGIAFQTNLLALNAAVEAARAGDAGKGFAVVASEVRGLAQRSSEASRDIRELIETSAGQVTRGVGLVRQTGEALEGIVGSIAEVESVVKDIADASSEQSTGVQEISATISHLDEMTQRNASMSEQSASNANELAGSARELDELLSFFRLGAAQRESVLDQDWRTSAAEPAAAEPVAAEPAAATSSGSRAWSEF